MSGGATMPAIALIRAPRAPLIPSDELHTLAIRQARYALERAQSRFAFWVDLCPSDARQQAERIEALDQATITIANHQARLKLLLSKTDVSTYDHSQQQGSLF